MKTNLLFIRGAYPNSLQYFDNESRALLAAIDAKKLMSGVMAASTPKKESP